MPLFPYYFASTHGCPFQDGSLDLDSRYGCTEPPEPSREDRRADRDTCGVEYKLPGFIRAMGTIASIRIGEPGDEAIAAVAWEGFGLRPNPRSIAACNAFEMAFE